ncbi:MAG: VWA domain-containing protein, partial [Proteobacteria bacterium]|nr:VWA domain-containing protein [Pseudomonadota bacterium]
MPAPVLSNELLRKKSMEAFLSAMKIDTTGIAIFSMEGVFSFTGENANQAEQLAAQLNTVVQKEGEAQQVRSISLADIIDSEIKNATCSDETNRGACQILFDYIIKVSGKNFSFSAESGVIELPLPHSNYAPMFNLLTYPHLTFDKSSSKLMLDIKKYLKDQKDIPESVIKVDGLDPTLSSTIFLNTSALESKKIFYATEELPNRTIKVTPYFFVPQAMTPPNYYFVLDVSDSMEKSLPDLKRAVSQLTTLLFDFQPNATVSITTFSNSLHHLGTYSKANDAQLKNAIARMRTENN